MEILADSFTVQDLIEFIEQVKDIYSSLDIAAAIGIPFFETLFPIIPLFLVIAFNILSYGLGMGYLYTFIGTTTGTIVIFIFMRYISTSRIKEGFLQRENIKKYLNWIERTHPALHILVLMIPFSPTFMINYSMGLSKMKFKTFLLITIISRAILLFICIPFGMTLITLYEAGELGGVQIAWLAITGVVVLLGIVVGQIQSKKIKLRKVNGN